MFFLQDLFIPYLFPNLCFQSCTRYLRFVFFVKPHSLVFRYILHYINDAPLLKHEQLLILPYFRASDFFPCHYSSCTDKLWSLGFVLLYALLILELLLQWSVLQHLKKFTHHRISQDPLFPPPTIITIKSTTASNLRWIILFPEKNTQCIM